MSEIALRVYTESLEKKEKKEKYGGCTNYDKILVFDTETTNDEYQNLKFGSFVIFLNKILQEIGLFYNPKFVSYRELKILQSYCKKNPLVKLYKLEDFVESIFYPFVYKDEGLCVGFNLPFDISRLAIEHGYARGNMTGGFTFKLSENRKYPPIIVKHNTSNQSFIKFQSTIGKRFVSRFVDLKTLAVTFTSDKHINLRKACDRFNERYKKIDAKSHGKITLMYIKYNLNDTLATYELFTKLKQEFDRYEIEIPIEKIYSSASLGKALLEQLGIKPFMDMNPDFPRELLGQLMMAYYGGRCEVKIRKMPTKVTVLDFTSMYPTMFNLTGLWDTLIADKIVFYDDTKNVKRFLERVTLEDLNNLDAWKKLSAIVEIQPDNYILPVRSRYGNEATYNVGLNYVKSEHTLYYALADVVASKILTGKVPNIVKAIRLEPTGSQDTLRKTKVLGIEIDPRKQNLFKFLVEEKERLIHDKPRRNAIKILINSMSYGIYIECNKENKKSDIAVYGKNLFIEKQNLERVGKYFNPLISTFITAGSRLVLCIVEALLIRQNETHAYCDTDSMFVSPHCVSEIQKFFNGLNPYSNVESLFKVEEEDIWFYGISSKRYVLYKIIENSFVIKEDNYSLHGLGHIINPFKNKSENWHKQVWIDILNLHYGKISRKIFLEKYRGLYSISQLTVSSKQVMKRFKKLNKRKDYSIQIKPFNFFQVGVGTDMDVKPMIPFSKNPQESVHGKFVNYKNGEIVEGLEYWMSLDEELYRYVNHKEEKMEGNIGLLSREKIIVNDIIYIGKESNNIENTGKLDEPKYTIYTNENELKEKILSMKTIDARLIGLNPEKLRQMKKRIKANKPLRFSNEFMRVLYVRRQTRQNG